MAVERRFLIAPSFARLIARESRAMSRIVEGHFPPHPDRFQLVRVERERAVLILAQRQEDGSVAEERAEIPHAHAEALIDVAAGTVAFDRMVVTLGKDSRALLDCFMLPRGIDVLTTVMEEGAVNDLPEWFGPEVTGQPEFEASGLALNGLPSHAEVEITDRGLEALLDTLEGRSPLRPSMPRLLEQVRGHAEPKRLLSAATAQKAAETDLAGIAIPEAAQTDQTGEDKHQSAGNVGSPEGAEQEISQAEARGARGGDGEVSPEEVQDQPSRGRQPRLRGSVREADEGIARIARSLAPRGSRPLH